MLAWLLWLSMSTTPALPLVPADQLSGDYRVMRDGAPDPQVPMVRIRRSEDGLGWQVWSGNDSVVLVPMGAEELRETFGEATDAGLQCGASDGHVICRVDPGTTLQEGGFVSTTGWFDVVPNVGPYELERIDPAP